MKEKKGMTKGSALKNAFIIFLSSVLSIYKQLHTEQGVQRHVLELPSSTTAKEFYIPLNEQNQLLKIFSIP